MDPGTAAYAAAVLLAASRATPGADIDVDPWVWAAFLGLIVALLLVDLLVLHRGAERIPLRRATIESLAWIVISLLFGGVVYATLGGEAGTQYLTGYVIEKSLSVDNVFVWAVIFSYFSVPDRFQHRVLFWGIFGALVLRAIFIFAGVALLERFDFVIYIFGAFLLFTAFRIAFQHSEVHPEHNPVLRLTRRVIPVTNDYREHHFFVREAGRRLATPLLLVLIVVEATDVVFAVDSVPAILAVSRSEFIVFSSNAFAILGLRALYFVLAGARDRLVHLNIGLAVILAFVGMKMLLVDVFHVDTLLSLGIVGAVLAITVVTSLRSTPEEVDAPDAPH
jgi:tellurite resistance protein TerC